MSTHNQWLFETPSTPEVRNYANSEYEISPENEWEMALSNHENSSLAEDEWEASPTRRATNRTRRPISRSSRPPSHRVRAPQRRPVLSRHQPKRASVGQRQLRQSVPSQGTNARAEPQILIATIDRFEFGSYLLKRHQFEQLHNLTLLLIANKDLESQVKLTFIGHTDNVGGEQAGNFHLAGRRAIEVENHIMRLFREKHSTFDLVSSIGGKGPQKPIAPNTTKDGQARNRRVEVFSNVPLKSAK